LEARAVAAGNLRSLPLVRSLLAICAHPDDESFGLGAALAAFTERHARAGVLCFTRGEASTLGTVAGDLERVRADELQTAAEVLWVERVALFAYPDGALDKQPLPVLAGHVAALAEELRAELLLVMDTGGITGHPDHRRATQAAIAAAGQAGLAVLAWVLRADVADSLRHEFGVPFAGRRAEEIHITVEVDRTRQLEAIACHRSQSADNRVLWRRLALQGNLENFCWLRD
jgi:N-acetylglucosamine malate deacetylase 2